MADSKYFFATKADLEPGLKKVEAWLSVKYIKFGFHKTPDVPEYHSALDIPGFGVSETGVYFHEAYFVLPADAKIKARRVPQNSGGVLYSVDKMVNPNWFMLYPGGWYGKGERRSLLGGQVSFYAKDADYRPIFSRYMRTLTKGFTVVPNQHNRKWWVGPEALEALKAGTRLACYDARVPDNVQIYLSLNGYDYVNERRER